MEKAVDLERFVAAQESAYETAFAEVSAGRKRSHWMWYIFPQLQGLGLSETAQFYAIRNREEAEAFLRHPILGRRLVQISAALLQLDVKDPARIFGSPDDLKLHSCMTLFAAVNSSNPVFGQLLQKFYGDRTDEKTLRLLNTES